MPGRDFIDRVATRFEDLDASARQAYLLRLARERGFFRTVFDAVDEGIMVIDRRLRLRYVNRAARELLALPEESTEVRISQLLPGVDWRRVLAENEAGWDRVARQELEIFYPEHRFVQFSLTPLPEDPTLAAALLRDVTEGRRRTMSELERETVRAVSLLAAGVAHEIGNPLNSLYLNLQLLERGGITPAESAEMIEVCKQEVERLDSIIHGFLNAIRPGKPEFAPVDIRELIVEVLRFMRPEVEARSVEVNCAWMGEIPKISGDAAQLKQAFYNIIRNAAQAMTNGGQLTVCGYTDEDFLTVEFADTGRGVSATEINTMFDAFRSHRSGGNGIGTMIIERVCREHGAEFGLVSREGRGTVFQIRFPLHPRRMRLIGEESSQETKP